MGAQGRSREGPASGAAGGLLAPQRDHGASEHGASSFGARSPQALNTDSARVPGASCCAECPQSSGRA